MSNNKGFRRIYYSGARLQLFSSAGKKTVSQRACQPPLPTLPWPWAALRRAAQRGCAPLQQPGHQRKEKGGKRQSRQRRIKCKICKCRRAGRTMNHGKQSEHTVAPRQFNMRFLFRSVRSPSIHGTIPLILVQTSPLKLIFWVTPLPFRTKARAS